MNDFDNVNVEELLDEDYTPEDYVDDEPLEFNNQEEKNLFRWLMQMSGKTEEEAEDYMFYDRMGKTIKDFENFTYAENQDFFNNVATHDYTVGYKDCLLDLLKYIDKKKNNA